MSDDGAPLTESAGGVSFRPFSGRWFSVLAMLGNLTSGETEIEAATGQGTAPRAMRPAVESCWLLAAASW